MRLNGHHPHILVMDESAELLAVLEELLGGEGYTVSTRSSVTHDLDEIAWVNPDLIILDHLWIHDERGWAQLRMLRMDPRTSAIPVILCTGAARMLLASLNARLREMEIQVVRKPFDIDDILQAVASALAPDITPGLDLLPFGR